MTDKKPKTVKLTLQTRVPQKRGRIFDNLGKGKQQNVKHPFSEIISFPDDQPADHVEASQPTSVVNPDVSQEAENIFEVANFPTTQPTPSNPTPPHPTPAHPIQPTPSNPTQPKNERLKPVSPEKNYTKVPNSLVKTAIPEGLFKGKSKQTYDILYARTRGAIVPARTIQITKIELMQLVGVSDNTLFKHISDLKKVGLISVSMQMGSRDGSVYEVFVPEELSEVTHPIPSHPIPPIQPHPTPSPKLGPNPSPKRGLDGMGKAVDNTAGYRDDKTYFKDSFKTDDESLRLFFDKFENISRKLTGRGLSGRDAEKWEELADLLILQLEMAARRTGEISNLPAFLTGVLRRKLMNQPAAPVRSEKPKKDEVGKPPEAETLEIVPLDDDGRARVVAELAEFAGEDFFDEFEKWYTPEDWTYVSAQLRTEK